MRKLRTTGVGSNPWLVVPLGTVQLAGVWPHHPGDTHLHRMGGLAPGAAVPLGTVQWPGDPARPLVRA